MTLPTTTHVDLGSTGTAVRYLLASILRTLDLHACSIIATAVATSTAAVLDQNVSNEYIPL